MTPQEIELLWTQLSDELLQQVLADETLTLRLTGETSFFARVNRARVRQVTEVVDYNAHLELIWAGRKQVTAIQSLTGVLATDCAVLLTLLKSLREDVRDLPDDPFVVEPTGGETSHRVTRGQIPAGEDLLTQILQIAQGHDFTGLITVGSIVRALANSKGQRHWFVTENFIVDYSLFDASHNAVKGVFADSAWNIELFAERLNESAIQLQLMNKPTRKLPRGSYRTYLAPAAVADLIDMFSWGAVSESAIRRGISPWIALRKGEQSFSPQFSLRENFALGVAPRFNSLGEMAPEQLALVEKGHPQNTLIDSRTAKEYALVSNGAGVGEAMRSPEVAAGLMPRSTILKELGTGLYVSNVHYLNWSDRTQGRVTGMTRYACFWVENGELVAPIENLRFDESIFAIFGSALAQLTDFQETFVSTGSYVMRDLGGSRVPGALVSQFTFTL